MNGVYMNRHVDTAGWVIRKREERQGGGKRKERGGRGREGGEEEKIRRVIHTHQA